MKATLAALLFLALPTASAFAAGQRHLVTMKSISFDPKVLEIDAGDTVVWQNKSYTDHSATEGTKEGFDTGSVAPKHRSKAIPFPRAGEFAYHCQVHGKTMSGTIRVRAHQP